METYEYVCDSCRCRFFLSVRPSMARCPECLKFDGTLIEDEFDDEYEYEW